MSTSHVKSPRGFRGFEFNHVLERNIKAAGYLEPRPIQVQTIPAGLMRRDILGLAQTGTGKTAAFALPILENLLCQPSPRGPRTLVVAPTRELAIQIDAEFRKLAQGTRIRTVVIYGGVSERQQIQKLRRSPEIIVACPGRLLDLHRRGFVPLGRVDTLVLDEADHMFDMGFLPDIKRILSALPESRQNLLFGATMPHEIRELANRILNDPFVTELPHSAPAKTIDHALYPVREARKHAMLEHFLAKDEFTSAIVFTRTKHRAKNLAKKLDRAGHRATDLQGNMSQSQRDRAMQGFRDGLFNVLVATDIAARGIDVEKVSHVINYDFPGTPEAYTHRIGRTGRSERSGLAATFVTESDQSAVRAIEKMIGLSIRVGQEEGFEEAFVLGRPVRKKPSGRPGGRPQGRNGAGPRKAKPRRRSQSTNRRSRLAK
jgi:ATP-dependent RNA helicase RhlE